MYPCLLLLAICFCSLIHILISFCSISITHIFLDKNRSSPLNHLIFKIELKMLTKK